MRTTRRLLAALAVGLAGCGGSGGGSGGPGGAGNGGGPPGPPITATYHLVGFQGDGTTARATWGRVDIDGAEAAFTTTFNQNQVVSNPALEIGIPFENDADGAVRFLDPLSGEPTLEGAAADGTSLLLLGHLAPGSEPSFVALSRRWDTGATAADLSGTYRVVRISYDGGTLTSIAFRLTFDGAGNGSAESGYILNANGDVFGGLRIVSTVTYVVNADGAMTLSAALGPTYIGGLHPSRELAILAGGSNLGMPPSILFLVKESTAADDSTFSGSYVSAGLALDYATPAFRSFVGETVADGAGNATTSAATNVEGTIGTDPAAPTTYEVAATGTLNLALPGAGALQGAVSPSGLFAALAGDFGAGEDPQVRILARKP